MKALNVENMKSPESGRAIANQFIIKDMVVRIESSRYVGEIFQSYQTMIAFKSRDKVMLDTYYAHYSPTTSKCLCVFLGESMKEITRKVKSGQYDLQDFG